MGNKKYALGFEIFHSLSTRQWDACNLKPTQNIIMGFSGVVFLWDPWCQKLKANGTIQNLTGSSRHTSQPPLSCIVLVQCDPWKLDWVATKTGRPSWSKLEQKFWHRLASRIIAAPLGVKSMQFGQYTGPVKSYINRYLGMTWFIFISCFQLIIVIITQIPVDQCPQNHVRKSLFHQHHGPQQQN